MWWRGTELVLKLSAWKRVRRLLLLLKPRKLSTQPTVSFLHKSNFWVFSQASSKSSLFSSIFQLTFLRRPQPNIPRYIFSVGVQTSPTNRTQWLCWRCGTTIRFNNSWKDSLRKIWQVVLWSVPWRLARRGAKSSLILSPAKAENG